MNAIQQCSMNATMTNPTTNPMTIKCNHNEQIKKQIQQRLINVTTTNPTMNPTTTNPTTN
jgi:hypothetical protein